VYPCIAWLCSLRGSGNRVTPVAVSTPSIQILVSNIIIQFKEPGPLEKWLILRVGQEIYKIGWKHLVVAESKENLKKKKNPL